MSETVYTLCIPYRDMPGCLRLAVPQVLARATSLGRFHLLVVEQAPGKRFNLGKLLNVGFDLYRSGGVPDYGPGSLGDVFIFQPVDCIPQNYQALRRDPSVDFHGFTWDEPDFYKLFSVTHATYLEVNGFSNDFWGWGDEDNEMLLRLKIRGARTRLTPIELTVLNYKESPDFLAGIAAHHDGSLTRRLGETQNVGECGLSTLAYRILSTDHSYGVSRVIVEI